MRGNGVPFENGMVYAGLSYRDARYIKGREFMFSADKTGGPTEVLMGRRSDTLGSRFGMEFFEDGQINTHTSGTVVSAGNDVAGAVNNASGYCCRINIIRC